MASNNSTRTGERLEYWLRIRGIYSTALTYFLLTKGFKIAQATEVILNRFKELEKNFRPPSATIKDRKDKKGVIVIGFKDAVEEIIKVLKDFSPHLVVRVYRPQAYSTYKGVVEDFDGSKTFVRITPEITGILFNKPLKKNEKVVVHVRKPTLEGNPILGYGIALTGQYLRLVENSLHEVSEHIRKPEIRQNLLMLARTSSPQGFGVRWRSSAQYANLSDLLTELEELKKKLMEVKKKAEKAEPYTQLTEGEVIAELVFPLEFKELLDRKRSKVIPTMPYHHFFKSINEEEASLLVDYSEKIEKCLNYFPTYLEEFLLNRYFKENYLITIYHETLSGKIITIKGKIEKIDKKMMTLKRNFKEGGKYDGLNEKIESGDYAITYIALKKPIVIHSYFSKDNTLKGIYVNINSPVEIYSRNALWYLDLEVDVIKKGNEVRIIDQDKLENSLNKGLISEDYFNDTLILTQKVKDLLSEIKKPDDLPKIFSGLSLEENFNFRIK